MTKIYCAALECDYHNDKNVCMAKEINLSSNSVMTVYDGRQNFNTCRMFVESEQTKKLRKDLDEYFKKFSKEECDL